LLHVHLRHHERIDDLISPDDRRQPNSVQENRRRSNEAHRRFLNLRGLVLNHSPSDDIELSPASVTFTKEYLAAFDQALASASTPEDLQTKMKARYPSLALDIILKIGAEAALPAVERNLQTFDVLDFDVFSNQKWDRLHESHAEDIVVTWPDGHETKGIDVHIADRKALFVWGPDIQIKVHPIRFGSGSWTAVTGVMTGTFTRPMPTPDGGTIAPTGKRFAIAMATIGHWVNGRMDHEWLFWDNQEFYKQIGLGK
jgi:hypothetical protein